MSGNECDIVRVTSKQSGFFICVFVLMFGGSHFEIPDKVGATKSCHERKKNIMLTGPAAEMFKGVTGLDDEAMAKLHPGEEKLFRNNGPNNNPLKS